jgi:hypothetical protein
MADPDFPSVAERCRRLLKAAVPATALALLLVVPGTAARAGGRKRLDTVPPAVAIVGVVQTTSTRMTVSGTASDNVGVTRVDVKIDGGAYAPAQGTATWSYAIDTSALAAGSHTVTARAMDAAGNSATGSVIIAVSAPVDSTPPTVAFSAPAANATVSGSVTISGSASDDKQLAKVELSVDGGAYQAAQGTTSWTVALDTIGVANGSHTLRARATDAAGNVGVASEMIVVSNDLAPPSVTLASPAAGATVSSTVAVAGTAADDVSVAKVEVAVDGGAYATAQGTTSWTSSIDTTGLANGTHTIAARATDAAGKVATVSVGITVDNGLPAGVKEQLVTPEGAKIQIYSDVTGWTAQQVYDLLKPSAYELAKIGPSLTIRVQTQYASATATGVSQVGGVYQSYRATIYLDARATSVFSLRSDEVVAHEYGHAWTYYHLYLTHNGDWSSYLSARGIANDPRVDSTYNWSKNEMIADDYRMLFGTAAAVSQMAYINTDVADPRTVPGLRDWFVTVWAGA